MNNKFTVTATASNHDIDIIIFHETNEQGFIRFFVNDRRISEIIFNFTFSENAKQLNIHNNENIQMTLTDNAINYIIEEMNETYNFETIHIPIVVSDALKRTWLRNNICIVGHVDENNFYSIVQLASKPKSTEITNHYNIYCNGEVCGSLCVSIRNGQARIVGFEDIILTDSIIEVQPYELCCLLSDICDEDSYCIDSIYVPNHVYDQPLKTGYISGKWEVKSNNSGHTYTRV